MMVVRCGRKVMREKSLELRESQCETIVGSLQKRTGWGGFNMLKKGEGLCEKCTKLHQEGKRPRDRPRGRPRGS
jgi:hypothetical protein